jgi:hypothetical protein
LLERGRRELATPARSILGSAIRLAIEPLSDPESDAVRLYQEAQSREALRSARALVADYYDDSLPNPLLVRVMVLLRLAEEEFANESE